MVKQLMQKAKQCLVTCKAEKPDFSLCIQMQILLNYISALQLTIEIFLRVIRQLIIVGIVDATISLYTFPDIQTASLQ